LSGLLFPFDKLNNLISTKGKVPIIADFMASRWAYEAMAVYQFTNNEYEAPYYQYEKEEAKADFKSAYLTDELKKRNRFVLENFESKNDSIKMLVERDLAILRDNLKDEPYRPGFEKINIDEDFSARQYSKEKGKMLEGYFEDYRTHYQKIYNENVNLIEKKMAFYEKNGVKVNDEKNTYYNESLSDLVKNVSVKERLLEYEGKLIQQLNPIFQEHKPSGILDYRTAFFLPEKNLLGLSVSTFIFDILVVWAMAFMCYVALYLEWLRRIVEFFGNVSIPNKMTMPFRRK
jgi:hypothetical protein